MGENVKDPMAVQVFIRARPLSQKEKFERAQMCVQIFSETNQIRLGEKIFAFDHVFAPEGSQVDIYNECGAQMLKKFLEGYNCTMLAYGQTGSGKTFTMGTEETKESIKKDSTGIIPRLISDLFQTIDNSACPSSYKVSVSMLEIYLEDVVDLLTTSSEPLNIREQKGTVFVQGLSSHTVASLEDTMTQLEIGCQARTKGSTAMNSQSSRSHAIFTVNLQKTAIDENECSYNAKFHLVDLAGSERLKKTQAEGDRKKEGIKINEGLLALGNVIQGLSDGVKHVPYRDSKITRLLQDSLGGNSCTMMIACISPADTNNEESLSTLRYADRAKRIKNSAVVNIDPQEARLKELEREILELRHENAKLKSGDVAPITVVSTMSTDEERDTNQKQITNLENELLETKIILAEKVKDQKILNLQIKSLREVFDSKDEPDEAKLSQISKIIEVQYPEAESVEGEQMEVDMEAAEDEQVIEEQGTALRTKYYSLDRQCQELSDLIKRKEELFDKTQKNDEEMGKIQEKHASETAELNAKIAACQKERDQLVENSRKNTISSKISEERRKRLQELEKELGSTRKRLIELSKLESWKKENEKNSKRMHDEIEKLKHNRIQLQKQLKIESDNFRIWKLKQERQMQVLKTKERKLELQAARKEQTLNSQLAVFKKKYQEAVGCNKRLQAQMLKSSTHNQHGKMEEGELQKFVNDEIALLKAAQEAKIACEGMLEFRKQLARKLCNIQAQLSSFDMEPPNKRRATNDREDGKTEESMNRQKELEESKVALEHEIENCNNQIRELQADTSSIDLSVRFEAIFRQIASLQDGKVVLRALFDLFVNECNSALEGKRDVDELKQHLRDAQQELTSKQKQQEHYLAELDVRFNEVYQHVDEAQVQIYGQIIPVLNSVLENAAMTTDQYNSIKEMYGQIEKLQESSVEVMKEYREHQIRQTRPGKKSTLRSASTADLRPIVDGSRCVRKPELFGNPITAENSFFTDKTPIPAPTAKTSRVKKAIIKPSPILTSRQQQEKRRTLVFDEAPCSGKTPPTETVNTTFIMEQEEGADGNTTFIKGEENVNATFVKGATVDKLQLHETMLDNPENRRRTNAREPLQRL
ncbi:unnamed protein product, partial [Mesorhabditis belari]|uniref:Kinesin motor domain-containing protein n=1 Tax=Mesorhabditis belari TaxID=2138241 RepID=A0AAF3ECV0_9BILA